MPGSKLLISRDKEIYDHALASTTCLLSGLEVFNVGYSHQDRIMRVFKGLHGFHVYANQYWVDHVLDIFASTNSQHQFFDLTTTLRNLSNALEMLEGLSAFASKKKGELTVSDNRLDLLKEYPGLHKNAKIAAQARSQKMLSVISSEEGKFPFSITHTSESITQIDLQQLLESPSVDLRPIRDLEDALANYQKTIQYILSLSDFPGVSKEDLERFKREYCTTAFTCRLFSCPRATTSFESETLRLEHEATHTLHLKCSFPGCQYPPFVSVRALKSHESRCHAPPRGRKKIRKVGSMDDMKMGFDANFGMRVCDFGSERNGMIEKRLSDFTVCQYPGSPRPIYGDSDFAENFYYNAFFKEGADYSNFDDNSFDWKDGSFDARLITLEDSPTRAVDDAEFDFESSLQADANDPNLGVYSSLKKDADDPTPLRAWEPLYPSNEDELKYLGRFEPLNRDFKGLIRSGSEDK